MHIDLNSCFATALQQAYFHLRNRPIAVAAYETPNGCVLAPSIEAKRFGVKTAMTVRDAKLLCPGIIICGNETDIVRDVHMKFRNICRDYSPTVHMMSIDELIIDFKDMERVHLDLIYVAKEIKRRFRSEIGEVISCNIGLSTNILLAKLAGSLHKPDGLDVITHENLKEIYSQIKLTDLNGINTRNEARLNANGIFNPLQFLDSTVQTLRSNVFQSILGWYWYCELRGYQIRDVEFKRRSYGQDYALGKYTADPQELARLLMKLTEKMGRRLRKSRNEAFGIHVGIGYADGTYWHKGRQVNTGMYTTQELFTKVMWMFNQAPEKKQIARLGVSCYDLAPSNKSQPTLFDADDSRRKLSDAMDKINDRYGEFVITPALMMCMGKEGLILDRIPFGETKNIEDLYS